MTVDPAPEAGGLVCPPGAPVVRATVAALRAADVGVETDYGQGQRDPDALLLVPLRESGDGRTAAELLGTIRAQLAGKAAPFVLRVEAGTCLRLTTINLLAEPAAPSDGRCRGPRAGDAPGDAPMPRITPLNVDCDPRQFAGSPEPFPGRSGPARPDLRPSGHLALSVPLPSPTAGPGAGTSPALAPAPPAPGAGPAGGLPVGANAARALPPVAGGAASRSTADYYAGFLWARARDVANHASMLFRDKVTTEQDAGQDWGLVLLAGRDCAPELQVRALGFALCMEAQNPAPGAPVPPIPAADAQRAIAERFAQEPALYREAVRAIPYAFGALPIRSLGDVVSHGAHGLLGVLVVEAADPSGRRGPADFDYRHAVARTIAAPDVTLRDGGVVGAATIHEHVLLWQDGLNLRRGAGRVTDLDLPGRPVPDCPVCDDSYDLGEKGVGLASERFAFRLVDLFASAPGVRIDLGLRTYPRDEDDLNRVAFPPGFFAGPVRTPTIVAPPGGQMAVRIAHPVGRARQRAFVPIFPGYDDLFPGFGSGHAALIGPGKGLTAWATAPMTPGPYLWRDGPQAIFAAGAWGHLLVRPEAPAAPTGR
ncbi:hypothetical protein EOE48_27195 [Methylobacterium oryzihabitans]|uniref:Uncharacterized protein n=1 Tax=Methylobacterium oryzihabitans TaxID=2499852 RepID=A0A437NSU3_9HYPH|nr:hypothetical protein EOE48_27195 [Methylobacterium oryzihabitans]